jgi:hypothetical protein
MAAMQMLHCPSCERNTGFKRSLGLMTLLAVLLSFGLWLLLIPLYPARCVVCGTTRNYALVHDERNTGARIVRLLGFAILALVIVWILRS